LTVFTLRVFTLSVITSSVEEVHVSGTTTELKPEVAEARHWIARQLNWERTLGSLREQQSEDRTQRAA
jgi:hypothetical protein